ncbi:MAG TPA: TIM-barrel domain-containing protein [Terracidiphilus sp.]|jgi:alpha-glucosidase (family GH31 glycosyl hydrolase)|nr:TIM-barrel domain-containing protein [Terracidiphilus sp.]
MTLTRRALLEGGAALSAQVLLSRRLLAFTGNHNPEAGKYAARPGSLYLDLTALSPNILRISISPADDAPKFRELGVVSVEGKSLAASSLVHPATIAWGKYSLKITDQPLHVAAFENNNLRQEIRFDLDSTDVSFNVNGPIFGLGEGVHPFDRRGTHDEMANGQHSPDLATFGARLPIPWVISPDGWGVFVGQPSGSFQFSQSEARFRSGEATSTRNVYLVLGDTPADVLAGYADLTGHPQLPPLWAFGYMQSHRTLASQEELLSVVSNFRDKKLPCDAVIYLGTGFCPSGWNTGHGSFTFNETVFPDPATTIQQIHEKHMKVILHVVPPGDFHGELTDQGLAAGGSGDAVPYWAKHTALGELGVDGWWPDEGDRLNVYARLQRNQMYFEGSRKDSLHKRPFALHRNGYAGLQRFGWLWSGDTFSTWDALRSQIMVGINIGLSGIPHWGTDTGGFVPTPDYSPELYVRWFQFSAFCPSFRSHGRAWKLHLPWGWNTGTTGPKEVDAPWTANWPSDADLHRPEIEQICRKFLNLRYQLLPYTYSAAADAHENGLPIIRALWLAYPHDRDATLLDDIYLWGDSILVAPVHEKGATQRDLYLPHGAWWDYWTSERVEGGKPITAPAPLDTMPLFVKAGAIVPFGPVKQYAAEPSTELVTLRVYPGADGRFRWYDDDGESFAFERDEFMSTLCEWSDSNRTLTLSRDSKGRLGTGRKLRVELIGTASSQNVTLQDSVTHIKL